MRSSLVVAASENPLTVHATRTHACAVRAQSQLMQPAPHHAVATEMGQMQRWRWVAPPDESHFRVHS